ncbi:stage II sporulation protein P [Ureibacillus composti]|uniref:Stage II sporulation protein P n=1 Tax=Lysinibacillus composti TaxID=720633 RepID=A0A3N9UM85_9BACI|nr:stage II sporulation protein P [Lysinibacillus composti]MBM7607024.1 stage II sporulation protein P [Lysinibacillus composti]MDM5334582.1 stage II sporulation protein P [Ureibacillus composti]RQW76378.1 stage II sporulation protein P [Lysinibacillus composti]
MLKKLKVLSVFLFFFFMLPIIAGQLPFPNNEKLVHPKEKAEEKPVVYAASSETVTATDVAPNYNPFEVLFVFTHSHETYKPVMKNANGTVAVYDDQTNLFSMQKTMADYFRLNGLTATTLDVDVMKLLKQNGAQMYQAYATVRPYLSKEIKQKKYDLILDIHRDSLPGAKTTIKHNEVNYAKVAFVIGAENPNYKANLSNANALNSSLNSIVPGISRGIIEKKGEGVDGVYNQDLAKEILLIEIGGPDNTEDEVYRTISILAQAIAKTFANPELAS